MDGEESLNLSDIELGDVEDEELDFVSYYSDAEVGQSVVPPVIPSSSSRKSGLLDYPWLSKISSINLDLCGSDLSQRIALSCPSGPSFKTEIRKLRDVNGIELRDQKQFTLLNHRNEKLLTVDFSKDRKSFHIMEPDSNTFIAFFTVKGSILQGSRVDIHNVIDGELYYAKSSVENPTRGLVIKSEKGEEMGTIATPPQFKWTQFLSGTMTLNFTGDEREGLTSREKAIVLGFLIAVGIVGMDYWKRSSSGLVTFYIFCIVFLILLVLFIYWRFIQEGLAKQKSLHLHRAALINSTAVG